MNLYEYLKLMPEGEELTVLDKDYDIEVYFYNDKPEDKWDEVMCNLSHLLTIKEIRKNGVIVNLSEVIENKIKNLDEANLFIECDIDSIMDNIDSILAGNVSENWIEKFVDALK